MQQLIDKLRDADYPVVSMTDNEMAKMHVRYMVGGHAPCVDDEVLYDLSFRASRCFAGFFR